MNYKTLLFTTLLLLLTSCGGGSSSSKQETKYEDSIITCEEDSTDTLTKTSNYASFIHIHNPTHTKPILLQNSISTENTKFNRQDLYRLFQTEYFWADKTQKELDYTQYSNPQDLIDDLKYEKDRWSFAITKEAYQNITSQKSEGFGFTCQDVPAGCHVVYVRIDSPVDKIGLKRGDVITKINYQQASNQLIHEISQEQQEEPVIFKILRQSTHERCSGKVTPRAYTYKVVSHQIIETNNHHKVGYFRLDSFLGDKEIGQQIDSAFDQFKKESLSKLIIDLRYNGGGSVEIASKLLNKLTHKKDTQPQFTLAWNDNYKYNDEIYRFKTEENSLDIEQLIFLTTQSSASASELVISAMKPYLGERNVIQIGDRTHGKPVGMSGKIDSDYYYFIINFVVKNSLGFYDYFDGLPVTKGCKIEDDPYHEMGDKDESMLKSALRYIDKGSCQE
jgi:C-terminal processing protease CtpA/Prc